MHNTFLATMHAQEIMRLRFKAQTLNERLEKINLAYKRNDYND